MFTDEEKQHIFDLLPKLNVKYEPKINSNFKSELYYVIPKGPKSLLWYTKWQHNCVCFLIHLTEHNAYKDVSIVSHSAVPELTTGVGTIVYGTHFSHRKQGFFTCEQLYYYMGENVETKPFHNILYLLHNLFTGYINEPTINSNSSIVIGLPVMATTFVEAEKASLNLPYKVYGIGAHRSQLRNKSNVVPPIIPTTYQSMKIQPDYHIPLLPLPVPNQQYQQPQQPQYKQQQQQQQQPQYKQQQQQQPQYKQQQQQQQPQYQHQQPQQYNKQPQPQYQQPQQQYNKQPQHQKQPQYHNKQQPSQPIVNAQVDTYIFNVKADESAEIYNLYIADSLLPYAIANISTLKTSNMMYNIFHNIDSSIKTTDDDSSLDLDKVVTMECLFSKENKKWTPIRQSYAISRPVTAAQLQYHGLIV